MSADTQIEKENSAMATFDQLNPQPEETFAILISSQQSSRSNPHNGISR